MRIFRSANEQRSMLSHNDKTTDQRDRQTGGIAIMNKHVPRKQQSMAVFSLSEDRPKMAAPSRTCPITVAFGAMNAVSDIFGRSSLRLNMAMLCCFRETCLFMIAIPLLIPLIRSFRHCDFELTSAYLRSGRDTHFDVSRRPSL